MLPRAVLTSAQNWYEPGAEKDMLVGAPVTAPGQTTSVHSQVSAGSRTVAVMARHRGPSTPRARAVPDA